MKWPRRLVERVFQLAEGRSRVLSWRELSALLHGSSVTIDDLLMAGLFIQHEERKRVWKDGQLRQLTPCPDTGEPSYFDGCDIWIVSRYERLFYYLQIPVLVEWLYQQLGLPDHNAPSEKVSGILWYMGEVRIPGAGFVPVWYGRILGHNKETIQEACHAGSRVTAGLMLTARVHDISLVGIKDIVSVTDGFCSRESDATVDWDMLSFLYQGRTRFPDSSDNLLYTLSEDGNALIEKVTGKIINLTGHAKPFFHYIVAELRKAPVQGVDFYKARDYAEYSASADTFGKMWSKASPYRKIVMRRKSRIFFVPYGSQEKKTEASASP